MTSDQHARVLRRKAGLDRPPPEIGAMSPAKAARLAMSKAGQDVLRLAVSTGEITESRAAIAGFGELLPKISLMMVLEGPGSARGLAALDMDCVTGLIEALTTGRLTDRPAPERAATQTDALLCRRFLAAMLAMFSTHLCDHSAAAWACGFAPGEMVADPRRLPHLLADKPFRVLRVPVDLGNGTRTGTLFLCLPWDGTSAQDAEGRAEIDAWQGAMEAAVMEAEVEIDAVLHAFRMPIARLTDLAPGDTLLLPPLALSEVALTGSDGPAIGQGKLGRAGGMRAVRLTEADTAALAAAAGDPAALGAPDMPAAEPAPPAMAMPDPAPAAEPEALPDPGELPALEIGGMADLPDLPDLPPLDDLPGMADLPQIID